ncbi:MAG TPA: maltose acetyltransferase domain-containing protein [Solirubrobacteraceae bacterium]|nr:maltose acetyltransferase domain-containing protein [Solirubrobacteraceae bacterium]
MANDKQHLLGGEPYLAGAEDLVADRRHARLLTERLNATNADEPDRRRSILAELLGVVGEQSEVLSPFACDYGYQISIGARTFINFGAVILDSAPVSIGDDVQSAPGCSWSPPPTPSTPLSAARASSGARQSRSRTTPGWRPA